MVLFFRILTALFLSYSTALGGSFKELDLLAREALENYFLSSDRPIQSIKLGELTALSQISQDYLLEADVVAKAAFGQDYVDYHCGVFLKRPNSRTWQVELTTCEAHTQKPISF